MMDIKQTIAGLTAERDRIDATIAALGALDTHHALKDSAHALSEPQDGSGRQ
jgi:hypothetical protein